MRFGPHSLRRANIPWRQEVGGSSIETSKIAGHASTAITEEYTFVQLKRQDELTRCIQDKREGGEEGQGSQARQDCVSRGQYSATWALHVTRPIR